MAPQTPPRSERPGKAVSVLVIFLVFAAYFAWRRNAGAPVLSHVTVDLVAYSRLTPR